MVDINEITNLLVSLAPLVGIVAVMVAVYFGFLRYSWVKNTLGWNFIKNLGKSKTLLSKGYVLLRVCHPSGGEEYQTVKVDRVIEYSVKIKDKDIKKYVIYDSNKVNYMGNVPVLNVNPNDIRPLDYKTGQNVAISSEIIMKLAADAAKKQDQQEEAKKIMKFAVIGIIAMGIIMILAISYMNQEVLTCAQELGRQAIIMSS